MSSFWRVGVCRCALESLVGMAVAENTVVTQASLMQIERRIQELERVRAVKAAGSWLYELDTSQIERLREVRDRILAARGGVVQASMAAS